MEGICRNKCVGKTMYFVDYKDGGPEAAADPHYTCTLTVRESSLIGAPLR